MAGLLGLPLSGQASPQLEGALALVRRVRQSVGTFLSQAQVAGSVTIGEAQIRSWEADLQSAARLIETLPVPLIFPPPAYAQLAQLAQRQIEEALAIIRNIPIVALLIFPPVPGQATLTAADLQPLLNLLQRAEALLVLAVQAAAAA